MRPHVVGSSTAQAPRGSAAPAATGWQLPGRPETLHAWHEGHAPLLQQTPSVHWPLAHAVPSAQVAPSGLRPQLPPMHTAGATQSDDDEHMVLHAPAPQA